MRGFWGSVSAPSLEVRSRPAKFTWYRRRRRRRRITVPQASGRLEVQGGTAIVAARMALHSIPTRVISKAPMAAGISANRCVLESRSLLRRDGRRHAGELAEWDPDETFVEIGTLFDGKALARVKAGHAHREIPASSVGMPLASLPVRTIRLVRPGVSSQPASRCLSERGQPQPR